MTQKHKYDCKGDRLLIRFPLEKKKYSLFSFFALVPRQHAIPSDHGGMWETEGDLNLNGNGAFISRFPGSLCLL